MSYLPLFFPYISVFLVHHMACKKVGSQNDSVGENALNKGKRKQNQRNAVKFHLFTNLLQVTLHNSVCIDHHYSRSVGQTGFN